jgi:hypothetical protein
MSSLESMIEKRHSGDGWIVLFELGNATGYRVKRHADAVAIGVWPSHEYAIHGYEVKRSRGDVKRELEEPAKADAVGKYCDYWWLVVDELAIIDGLVIPETWGVLVPRAQVLRVHKKAPKRKATPLDRAFSAAVIRRVCSEWTPSHQLKELERITLERATAQAKRDGERDAREAERQLEDIRMRVAAFEQASGVTISGSDWHVGKIGEAVKVVMEARQLTSASRGYSSPEQLVRGEIAYAERSIRSHREAIAALEHSKGRLEILSKTLNPDQATLPELP